MGDNIVNILTKAPEILDNQYLRDKELEEKSLKKIKSRFDFNEIIDGFNQDKVKDSLKFFCGGENKGFYLKCKLLDLKDKNERFVEFLNSNYCSRIMCENKLTIHKWN